MRTVDNSTSGEITKQITIQVSGGAPFTTFTSDATTINNGQCTTLHWTSGNIQSIFLNNQAATGNENRQVCPTATTTYTLLAHSASGDITKQITITVNGGGGNPPPDAPPVPKPVMTIARSEMNRMMPVRIARVRRLAEETMRKCRPDEAGFRGVIKRPSLSRKLGRGGRGC